MTTQGTYDDIDPSIVYLVDSPLREEFEKCFSDYPTEKCNSILPNGNFQQDLDGEYMVNNICCAWMGYHDRALQENLKLRDTPVMRELSDKEIYEIAEKHNYAFDIITFTRAILSAAKGSNHD